MKYTFLLFFSCFILTINRFSAQSVSACLRKAQIAVDQGKFDKADNEYKKALALDSSNKRANLEYGLFLFEYIHDPGAAGKFLLKAERNSGKDTFPELLFGLAKYHHYNGDQTKAIDYYQRFYRHIDLNDPDGKLLAAEVNHYLDNCRFALADKSIINSKRIHVKNAGAGINTIFPEYVPVLSSDGNTLMFTSRRKISSNSKVDSEEGGYYEDMFVVKKEADGSFKNPVAFSLQSEKLPGKTREHESAVSLSFVGDKFYTFYNGLLFESDKKGNDWNNPVLVGNENNRKDEFKNHIFITRDGTTMYYSAESGENRKLDIYKCVKKSDGKWSTGERLGDQINTSEDDGDPQMSEDGKTFYFASKGLPGYGGYDLFRVKIENGIWGTPENMAPPYNSPGDDIYLFLQGSEVKGMLSSSRKGGYGDMDIYEIGYEKPFEHFRKDSLDRLQVQAPDTAYVNEPVNFGVTSFKLPPSEFAAFYWEVGDSILAKQGEVNSFVFDKEGEFMIRAEADMKNGSILDGMKTVRVMTRPVIANNNNNTALTIESVYFEYNSARLDEEANAALLRNAALLKDKQTSLELIAYADPRGSSQYNLALSKRRAQAVATYLRSKGFKNIALKWMGENDPISKCNDATPCTEAEYKINRRVELTVSIKKN